MLLYTDIFKAGIRIYFYKFVADDISLFHLQRQVLIIHLFLLSAFLILNILIDLKINYYFKYLVIYKKIINHVD